ncbi:MAG: SGNH/GDSL hydrolase family protein [Thermomicrobiales bacterium]
MMTLFIPHALRQTMDRRTILRTWMARLDALATATPQRPVVADVLVIGDSITESLGASTLAAGWTRQLKANMNSLLSWTNPAAPTQPSIGQGMGYVPMAWWMQFTHPPSPAIVAPWPDAPTGIPVTALRTAFTATNGSGLTYGLAGRSVELATPSACPWQLTALTTGFDVIYTRRPTRQGVSDFVAALYTTTGAPIGSPVRVHTQQGSSTAYLPGVVASIGPLPAGTYQLRLSVPDAGNAVAPLIEGVYVHLGDETAGIRVWEAGHSGATTGSWSTNTLASPADALRNPLALPTYAPPPRGPIHPIAVALVIIALGINDFGAQNDPATILPQLTTLVGNIRAHYTQPSPSILIVCEHFLPPQIMNYIYPWTEYVQMLYRFALDHDLYVADVQDRLGNPAAYIPSLTSAAFGHPNDIAQRVWADTATLALLR